MNAMEARKSRFFKNMFLSYCLIIILSFLIYSVTVIFEAVKVWPFIYSTKDEQNIISQYLVDITTYVDEMNVAFITGTTDLSTFDSYLSTLDSMGLKELLKVKQQQYDRFISSTK
nr:hypothetical protein [uncultured Clostridium sp.]